MELFQPTHSNAQFAAETRLSDVKNTDHFIVDDLLDFPSDENEVGTSEVSSVLTAVDHSRNSSFSNFPVSSDFGEQGEGPLAGELCVPYDDMAELEWLSTIVEESFTSEDLQNLHLIQGVKATTQYPSQPEDTRLGPTIPAKARSKRSRAAPGNWTSRLAMVAPPSVAAPAPAPAPGNWTSGKKLVAHKKKESPENPAATGGEGRKCLHCETEKTPQWRTGPMGPKTLCNACGVRYKSGRLVPEYRPASSPSFMLTKHSNSHRKVMELRQKEMMRAQQQLVNHHRQIQSMMFDVSNGEDYSLIHQHVGPDFRQII